MTNSTRSSQAMPKTVEGVRAQGEAAPAASPARSKKMNRGKTRALELGILIVPALVLFVAFVIFPVVSAAYYGFFSWQGYGAPTDFVGFKNYFTIFKDPTFIDALKHNGIIVILSLVMQGPVALFFALLLNRKMRGQSVVRVLIFVPYVISEVVVGTGWSLMLGTTGAVNDLLEKIGLGFLANDWISDPDIAIWSLMVIITWKYVGFAVILFLAGLQGIPQELNEAASIDGASWWQLQRRITIPLLGPTVRIWAFLSIIGSIQLFDLVYIIWGQYVAATAGTSTMATYMVANGRNAGNYGYGNAVAVVLFLVSFVVAMLYQRYVLNRDNNPEPAEGKKK